MDFRWGKMYGDIDTEPVASVCEMWWNSELKLKRSRDHVINGLVYHGN